MPIKRPTATGIAAARRRTSGRNRRPCCAPGFTLLELAVVLFIMGLIMSVALPYFGGLTNARLKSEARRLAGRATYLYDAAASDKLVMRLNFDLDNNGYFVTSLDPYRPNATFHPAGGVLGQVAMPPGIRLRDVTIGALGTATRGVVGCVFYPTGWVDATIIHLAASDGEVFTLTINPLTGRVAILAGDLNPRQALLSAP